MVKYTFLLGRCVVALKRAGFDMQERSSLLLGSLLGEKDSLDVWQDTTLGNGDSRQEFVQFFVITDGQLQVTGDDSCLLVVTGSVSCQFQHFSGQVFHDSCQIDGSTSTDTLGIVAFAQVSVDSSDWELKPSTG